MPGMEKRKEFLRLCWKLDIPDAVVLKLTEPMRGKTREEKERMAAELTKEILAGKYPKK